MKFSLIPREYAFFEMFEKLAGCAVEAAHYFNESTTKGVFSTETALRMRNIEHRGDDITHEIINKLNKTFITPIDREDIYSLAHELDSVIDLINSITCQINLYNISGVHDDLIQFSSLIKTAVDELAQAVGSLHNLKKSDPILQHCIEVNRLENMGDQLRDTMIGNLFDNSNDPVHIIKWKDIFQDAEAVLDKCEDVVNIVEAIIVKQA
jgi:predicted phosphate transport protein (TIGR00153 family)